MFVGNCMKKLQALHTVPSIPHTQTAQMLLQAIPPAWTLTQLQMTQQK